MLIRKILITSHIAELYPLAGYKSGKKIIKTISNKPKLILAQKQSSVYNIFFVIEL
jgi:hypothetical protein